MSNNKTRIMWGLVIILLGVLFLGSNLKLWNINLFFRGWWTLFIIVPSFVGMIKDKTYCGSFLAITIGVLMLCACQEAIEWSMVGKIFLPVVLVVLGFSLLIKPTARRVHKVSDSKEEYVGVFAETNEKITTLLKDTSIVSVFGSVNLDLTEADIKEDVYIDCVSVFGGIEIKTSEDVYVKSTGVPIFGGLENKNNKKNDKKPIIYINYVCIFGGVDIK